MKKESYQTLFVFIVPWILILGMLCSLCGAEDWNRRGRLEIFATGQQINGDSTTASDAPFTIELDDTVVFGLGLGYNFTEHVNFNADMLFGSTDIIARGFGVTVQDSSDLIAADLNLDVNILKKRFTPYITGGIGFINFQGGSGQLEFNETDFSYNLGAGLRWEATKHLLIKAFYRGTWTKLEDTDDAVLLDGVNLSIGYIF
jgi:opacity protein-like surface antigen